MTHVLGTVLALALAVAGQPATKPDFTGEWKANMAKSNFGAIPPPTSIVRKITHKEPSLVIEETQEGGLGDPIMTRKYVTDGTKGSFMSNGAEVVTSAKWSGAILEIVSSVDAIGLSFNDKMSLSADGKTMTSAVQIASPQGNMDITVVFEKQ